MILKKTLTFETTFTIYTSKEIIGEGGSGRIYKAFDESENAWAIKLLDPGKITKDKVKRFKNELQFCLRNQHRNIITVIDHGVFTDAKSRSPFYVMPSYSGSLRQLIQTGIKPDNALRYFSQILDGIEAAHLQKVIHRDLKPENILYDKTSDNLVLADFGIARFEEEELFTIVETKDTTRLANFQYAAPEQRTRNLQVDHRADIYALGLILNEVFTHEVPQGTNFKTIGSIAPDYSYLDELVAYMLRQDQSMRPQSIEIIKRELIGRKQEFVTRQRLSTLKQTVIPVTDTDDPLLADPPRIVNFDWNNGTLKLFFHRPVNDKWVLALQNMRGYTSVWGKDPHAFRISGQEASIRASEHEIQQIIDYFKQWLPNANRTYAEMLRREKADEEAWQRKQLQAEIEEQERRQRILKNIKI